MFKNPLKYQNGGDIKAREQVVNAISEIAQIPVEEVNSKLQQISQDQESIQLLSEALQAAKNGDERGYQIIKQMFNSKFKDGGKIKDFICKHAKGGKAGCGCKQEGGSIRPGFEYLGENVLQDRYNPNFFEVISNGYRVNGQEVAVPTRSGAYRMGADKDNPGAWDNGEQVYTQEQFDNIRRFYEESLPNSNRVQGSKQKLAGMQEGGIMQKYLPFTVSSLGAVEINPAELEKKAIMMRQRPMYAKDGGKTEKYQNPAGTIGRRQALDAAKTNYGYNDGQAKFAYTNAKSALRNQGLRGRELRQQARQMLMGQREQIQPIVKSPELPQSYQAPETGLTGLAGGSLDQQHANNYRQIKDYSGNNFDSAFSQARSAYLGDRGPRTFMWKGTLYNTDLDKNTSTENSWSPTPNVSNPNTTNAPYINPGVATFGDMSWIWSLFKRR